MFSNKWMNDVNVIAQFAHSGISYAILLTIDRFHPSWFWYSAAGMMLWATSKEFIYDARFETPKQSFKDNLTDFSFYGLGTSLAAIVHFVGLLPKFLQ